MIDRSAFRLTRRQLGFMAILGIAGVALLQASYAAALQRLPVGIALLLEYMAVLIVALVAYFFLKEQVKARLWVAIALVLAGLAVVARVWDSHLDALGVVFALVAAVTLALYFLVGERQVGATSPARRRLLHDGLRRAVLVVPQRMVGAHAGDLQRPGAAGRRGRRLRVAALAAAARHGRGRVVPAVPVLLPRPQAPPSDGRGNRRRHPR